MLGHTDDLKRHNYQISHPELVFNEVEAHTVALSLARELLEDGKDYNLNEELRYILRYSGTQDVATRHIVRKTHKLSKAAREIYQAGLRDTKVS